jgi:uncharacterized membrane protein YccC
LKIDSTPSASERANLPQSFQHVARTTIAALASMEIASLFTLPEWYWAGIASLVVMQSTLKAAWEISLRQLIGTALGATTGAVLYQTFGPSLATFAVGILIVGLAAIAAGSLNRKLPGNMDRSTYRFAGVALIVVLLIPHTVSIWRVARDRFCEYAVGILVALAVELIWPDRGTDSAVPK